jgi:integrase
VPKNKLTDALVQRATLPAGQSDQIIWDTEVTGFGLRIRASSKSFLLAYRPRGEGRAANTKRLKIGAADAMKVAEARSLARIELGKIASGLDPQEQRAKRRNRQTFVVSTLLDGYAADLERRGYVNRKGVLASLRAKMRSLLTRDVREITSFELAAIIERLEKAGQSGAAQDFRSRSRAFFTWCMTKPRVLSANPFAGIRKERATRADRLAADKSGRALDDAELRAVWLACPLDRSFGRLVRFLVLTGCRRGEGAGLTWQMIDRERAIIELPAQFVKQGRGHVVPITAELAEVLDACPTIAGSDLVFTSARTRGKMSGFNKMVAALVRTSEVKFSLHDLRRTFRTGLSRLGVDLETAELALGHARTNLEAIYNRDQAGEVLRAAFQKWADHVSSAVSFTSVSVFD